MVGDQNGRQEPKILLSSAASQSDNCCRLCKVPSADHQRGQQKVPKDWLLDRVLSDFRLL